MLYPYTAQCPSCGADQNLSQADLGQEKGNVICTNCSTSFYAPNHLLKGFYAPKESVNFATNERTASLERGSVDKMSSMDTDDIMFPSSSKYSAYRRKRLLKRTGLLFVNFGLILFFLFQLFWINFDKWAAREHFRPIYSFLCAIENLNCQLPAWIKPSTLALENFQVGLKDNSVYVMQATLINKDNKLQAFPWVDVIFSDINGIAIASGRFSPYQYLLPEITDSLMNRGSSYDILLEVQKPSHPVVSYEMRLVAAAP